MNIEHLRAFVLLASTLNYTKTAAELYVSQPALTKQIKGLENFLGTELFERTSRSVRLTEIGAEFLVYARNCIQEYDAGIQIIANHHSFLVHQINLGTHMFFSHLGFSSLISSFQLIFPNVYINSMETLSSSDELILQLRTGKLDAAIFSCVTSHTDPEGVRVFPLLTDEIVVIAPAGHPLSAEVSVELKDLAEESFVFPTKNYTWHSIMRDVFAAEALEPKVVCESALDRTIVSLVAAGTGLSMFSLNVAQALKRIYPAISILRLSKRYEKVTAIGVRTNYKSNRTLNQFVEFAQSWALSHEEFPQT